MTNAQPSGASSPIDSNDRPVRVLIVDDDAELRKLVRNFLQSHAFEVFEADGAHAMRAVLANQAVDVVVLDVMMPGEDGLSLARGLAATSRAGVIIVSALGQENDRIIGLEAGADDYLPKPVSPRELLARIRAILRRRSTESPPSGSARVRSIT